MVLKLLCAALAACSSVGARAETAKPHRTAPADAWTAVRRAEKAQEVREAFLHAWNSYRKYAWGHDELQPISKQPHDWYGVSLYMTPIDGLDTLIVMGLKKEADEDRELIATKCSFDQDVSVKGFEIGIRLLGGLLSSYQLSGDKRLLALADDLGTRMMPLFNSPTGIPYVNVNLRTGATEGTDTNAAEVGTYLLEFGTLSRLTGKPEYYAKAKNAVMQVYNRRSSLGLVGVGIDAKTGKWTSPICYVGGGVDSYYEYLLKCAKLFGDADCWRMWRTTRDALNKNVAETVPSGFWYGEVDMNTGARLGHSFGALDAFYPAVLALDGDLKRAEALEDSCYKMWKLNGIEPERLNYATMKVTSAGYPLRPEIIESAYYLRRITGNSKYLDMGQTYFDDLVKYCENETAFTALRSVVTKEREDDMESFFFAETLKYSFLIFAPDSALDFKHITFNTEAHPLRRTWK